MPKVGSINEEEEHEEQTVGDLIVDRWRDLHRPFARGKVARRVLLVPVVGPEAPPNRVDQHVAIEMANEAEQPPGSRTYRIGQPKNLLWSFIVQDG